MEWDGWRPGVLNKDQMGFLCEGKRIKNADPVKMDASSFDLHLSNIGYKMKGSFKPSKDMTITEIIQRYKVECDDFRMENGNFKLNKNETYIFQIKEALNLSDTFFQGQATGRSTIGRLDILARLLTSDSNSFDVVEEGYNGSLWVEVTPITFNVIVKEGMSVNQLRLFKGSPNDCRIDDDKLHLWGDLIFVQGGQAIPVERGNLTLNLEEDPKLGNGVCAFKAVDTDDYLDITKDFGEVENKINPDDYWQPITIDREAGAIDIEKEKFYILRSYERFKLPKSVAIYCKAVAETLGELRIHYAGFVHPHFGAQREDDKGAPLIFEVRGHNIKNFLRNRETLAKLEYYSMSQDAAPEKTPYDEQELKLSSVFNDFEVK